MSCRHKKEWLGAAVAPKVAMVAEMVAAAEEDKGTHWRLDEKIGTKIRKKHSPQLMLMQGLATKGVDEMVLPLDEAPIINIDS